jgi:hypothetical protein
VCKASSRGLSIRVTAEDLGMPYHTLHSWFRDKRRALRKTIVKAPPKTMVDAQACAILARDNGKAKSYRAHRVLRPYFRFHLGFSLDSV